MPSNDRIKVLLTFILTIVCLIFSTTLEAQVIYEPFDYTSGTSLNGQAGGTGFGAAWSASNDGGTDIGAVSPGLTFSTLPVAGNRARRTGATNNRAIASRILSGASQTALTADNSTIWFSVLFDEGTSGDLDFAFTFGDTSHGFPASGGPSPGFNTAGNAFGFAADDDGAGGIYAIEHDNNTNHSLSSGSLALANTAGVTRLFAGKINWNPIGTDDELFLFNITDPAGAEPTEGLAFATHTANFNQSAFNLISMWDRPATAANIDEIRFATTFEEVVGREPPVVEAPVVPEPSAFALAALGLLGMGCLGRRQRKRV